MFQLFQGLFFLVFLIAKKGTKDEIEDFSSFPLIKRLH